MATQQDAINTQGLSSKASPTSSDYALILDAAANNNLSKATLSSIGSLTTAGYLGVAAVTNYYYYSGVISGSNVQGGSFATTLNTLYYFPFIVMNTSTYKLIGFYNVNNVAANANLGLYNSNASNNAPTGSPITNSTTGSISTVGTGQKTFSFASPITLNTGIYWVGLVTSSSSISTGVNAGPGGASHLYTIGYSLAGDATKFIGYYTQSFTYNAVLPSVGTLTAVSPSQPPLVYMQGN